MLSVIVVPISGSGRIEITQTKSGIAMASAVDNGLVAARLLAGATTSPLPRGSNNSYNTPGGTTANRSSRKGGYQIEHIWADRPERHEDDFRHPADFAPYRNRIGGLVLLPAGENASYSDMAYEQKVKQYAKQNLLAQSLSNIAYENKPGFRRFQEKPSLPFAAKAIFKRTDRNDRQALYISLANHCWSPDRLNDI